MFATFFSGSRRSVRIALLVFAALLPRLGFAQELALAVITPPSTSSATAVAQGEPQPEAALSLLERLETLEQLSEDAAPAELKALFAAGLPCQIHSRSEEGAELTEVHPLFPANAISVEAAPAAPAPAPVPMMSPSPRPAVQAMTPATSLDAPFVTEKIKSLQKMVELMHAKEKLMASRVYYERRLGEFDNKVGKQ
ncbi:hypothetical protein HUU05_30225 [candidate division KSB1 bacterium]|nr:hypothetical protein [candidate division KSB1 bacterium]